jgi:hypothetical protein
MSGAPDGFNIATHALFFNPAATAPLCLTLFGLGFTKPAHWEGSRMGANA